MEFVESQRTMRRDPGDPIDPSIDLTPDFDFSAHEEELVVGGVFLRVYNEQPSFPIQVSVWYHQMSPGAAVQARFYITR